MATVELERLLALLAELGPEDWKEPTACIRWDVRQIVAHLVGFADAYSDVAEFRRQGNGRRLRPYRRAGLSRLEAMNQIAVDDRADLVPSQIVERLRERGPRAIHNRDRLPAVLRHLPLPLGTLTPELRRTWVPIGYVTDLIMTRDMWMHRLDISRAAEMPMLLTPAELSVESGQITLNRGNSSGGGHQCGRVALCAFVYDHPTPVACLVSLPSHNSAVRRLPTRPAADG